MTVIATLINKYCCAFATDSLITFVNKEAYSSEKINETFFKKEYIKPKIIPIRRFSGALAYYGLARINNSWSMFDWLTDQVRIANQCTTPVEFANHLQDAMSNVLKRFNFEPEYLKGMGIHFSAYEIINGLRIPELFVIRNINGTHYQELYPDGIRVYRSTYDEIPDEEQIPNNEQGAKECRMKVYDYLQSGGAFLFNNGDPDMFMSCFQGLRTLFTLANRRGILSTPNNTKAFRKIIEIPVRSIIQFHNDFITESQRKVGGKIHSVSITPNGQYESDTDRGLR